MLLGFKKQFVPKIQAGTKIHTLRDDPADRWKLGNKIHMATGIRTPKYNCFNDTHNCKSTQMVTLGYDSEGEFYIQVFNGQTLAAELHGVEQEIFAKNDGFDSLEDLKAWFDPEIQANEGTYTHKKLIHWTDYKY